MRTKAPREGAQYHPSRADSSLFRQRDHRNSNSGLPSWVREERGRRDIEEHHLGLDSHRYRLRVANGIGEGRRLDPARALIAASAETPTNPDLYQVVWLRICLASFGVITPVLSVVISVFMFGLFAGSWVAGRLVAALTAKTRLSAVWFYALAELVIGVGAFAVPHLFGLGERALLPVGQSDSARSGRTTTRRASAFCISPTSSVP